MPPDQFQGGLAKEAPQPKVEQVQEPIHQEAQATIPNWNGIPLDIYAFLNVDFFSASEKNLSELKDIYDFIKPRSNGMPGDIIQKLDEMQNRLGQPSIGTSRLAQLSNYVRVNRAIQDMQKQKRAMEKRWG